MAFGDHWEWRGFGRVSASFRAWFLQLPPLALSTENRLHDEYLWTPGCIHNVKLRYDALKFKRFLAREGQFERWLEAEKDFLPFPLSPTHLQQLESLLNVSLPPAPTHSIDRDAFLRLIAQAHPRIYLISVVKQRRLHRWLLQSGEELIVEWTHILQPEPVETVALECQDLPSLRHAFTLLRPKLKAMRPMNYVAALSEWVMYSETE